MSTQFLTIGSGAVVTSGVALSRADAALVVVVPSMSAAGWMLEFATTATDSSAFVPLTRLDGTGGPWVIFSGRGRGVPTDFAAALGRQVAEHHERDDRLEHHVAPGAYSLTLCPRGPETTHPEPTPANLK